MAKQFTGKGPAPKRFTFKYIKTSDFKTIIVNGIYGGATVQRNINMNFYVDTSDIPSTVSHVIDSNRIGAEIPHEKEAITAVREIPFGVIFDVPTAKSVVIWLNEKIKEIEKQNATILENFKEIGK